MVVYSRSLNIHLFLWAREAESEAEKLSQSNKAGLFWNLASAAKKIGEKELECEYLFKCMTNCTIDQNKIVVECEKRPQVRDVRR